MSNIYLQVPYYVDCFYRCRAVEEKDWIQVGEPLEFLKFSEEYYVLHHHLTIDEPLAQGHKTFCFSQRAWKTMQIGKSPVTGEKLLLRDKDEYLSVAETNTILNIRSGANADNSAYLCIKMPNEVFRDGRVHSTNASYTLSQTGVKKLRGLLMQEFQRAITVNIKTMEHYVVRQGGQPQRIDLINAFLSRYGIFKVADHKDRESLRRMLNRWLGDNRYVMDAERIAAETLPYVEAKPNVFPKDTTHIDLEDAKALYNAARRERYRNDEEYRKREQKRARDSKRRKKSK